MPKSVKERIAEFARAVKAIQDLSLSRLSNRRQERLADYELTVTAIIVALKRINQDEIWRDAATRLTAFRKARYDANPVGGSLVRNAVQCRTILQNEVHDCLVQSLQAEVDAAFKDATLSNRHAALATRLSRWPCSRVVEVAEDGRSATLDSRKLYLLAVADVFAVTGVTLEVKLERKVDEITFEDLLRITGDVRNFALTIAYITMKPGSSSFFVQLTAEDAEKAKKLFENGGLRMIGGISVMGVHDGNEAQIAAFEESAPVMLDLSQPLTKTDFRKLAEFMRREQKRARQTEPTWATGTRTILFSVVSWLIKVNQRPRISIFTRFVLVLLYVAASVCDSLLNLVFVWFPHWFGTRESEEHLRRGQSCCIVRPWEEVNRIRFIQESFNAFVIWPLMTATAVAAILLAFVHPGAPVLLWAAASGAFLSTSGGLVCSSVFSIRACGAARVALGTGFGVAHGLIAFGNGGVASAVALASRGDVFTRIVGGLVVMDAHRAVASGLVSALLALGIPALGIASSARLMAQPLALSEQHRHRIWREVAGAVLGSLVGIGVFFVMGATQLLSRFMDGRIAFLTAKVCISAVVLICLFRLRITSNIRIAEFALIYSIAATILAAFALWSPPNWPSLLANSGATAMFQTQFFTLAWLVGYRIGGWRAGVTAATLEGVGGYIGFALIRAF
jgi:hypothetical protein